MKNLLIIIIFIPIILHAQEFNFQFESNSILVEIDGWSPYCPWSGGMSCSNPDFADLNNDRDLNVVIGMMYGGFRYYENIGNFNNPDFVINNVVFNSITEEGWSAPNLCDIDNDGDLDLFPTSDERVWFYENIGNPESPQFEFITDSLEQII